MVGAAVEERDVVAGIAVIEGEGQAGRRAALLKADPDFREGIVDRPRQCRLRGHRRPPILLSVGIAGGSVDRGVAVHDDIREHDTGASREGG